MTRPKVKAVPSPIDSDYHKPRTVEDVTEQNVQAIAKLEEAAKANRSQANRLADRVASFCGSITFVWVHVFWFGGWVVLNSLPGLNHFDPYPFTFLTFVVSLEAIFLSTFILISQNHETQLTERRRFMANNLKKVQHGQREADSLFGWGSDTLRKAGHEYSTGLT